MDHPALREHYREEPAYRAYFDPCFDDYLRVVDFAPGETVVGEGPPEMLYLMLRGRCHIRAELPNGKAAILQTMRPPCLIGEMELLRSVSPFTVRTLERCRMLALPLTPCGPMLRENVTFLRKVASELVWKERTEALVLLRSFAYPLENRLAAFLLDNCQGDQCAIRKVHMAESLGVSYRHVETVMSRFVGKGWLGKEALVYTIENRPALEALARELREETLSLT